MWNVQTYTLFFVVALVFAQFFTSLSLQGCWDWAFINKCQKLPLSRTNLKKLPWVWKELQTQRIDNLKRRRKLKEIFNRLSCLACEIQFLRESVMFSKRTKLNCRVYERQLKTCKRNRSFGGNTFILCCHLDV